MLSILIVHWNTRDDLRACLVSLRQHPYTNGDTEIIVVDNASSDGSPDMVRQEFPEVRLIANATNENYARGTNQALSAATGDLLLLLNPDTQVYPNALNALCAYLLQHQPQMGAAAARLMEAEKGFVTTDTPFPLTDNTSSLTDDASSVTTTANSRPVIASSGSVVASDSPVIASGGSVIASNTSDNPSPTTVVPPSAPVTTSSATEPQNPEPRTPNPKPRTPKTQPSIRGFPEPAAVLCEILGLARLFPRSPRFAAYRHTFFDYDREGDAPQPMATCFLLTRKAYETVGPMDERFPLFFNDVDWCLRCWNAGLAIGYTPDAVVLHKGGGTTSKVRKSAIWESRRAWLRLNEKHYKKTTSPLLYHLLTALLTLDAWRQTGRWGQSLGKNGGETTAQELQNTFDRHENRTTE